MYTKLKELFGTKTPSVRMFKSLLGNLPESEQLIYKKAAVDTAFCDWENTPERYRLFLGDLFQHHWQKTLDYLLTKTVLGLLGYDLQQPELLRKVFSLLEGKKENGFMPSYLHLSFVYLLAFHENKSVEYFGDLLREGITSDDLCELFDLWNADNESGHLPAD